MTAKPIFQLLADSRALRELIMRDRARPAYHTVCPEDDGVPGDPNATFYANGRVHLMFLYHCEGDGFRFGHLSCADLLHWHRHPDALIPDELDRGIFSGGAFVDDDGTVYIAYWSLKGEDIEACNNGIRIAYSRDIAHDYTHWKKMPEEAVAATEHGILTVTEADGTVRHLPAADPSNIWKKDGFYYLQAGNLPVLNRYGREGGTAEYSGDYTELYRSRDLHTWKPLHRFYMRRADNGWTAADEDAMCPCFLPLPSSPEGGKATDTYLQLFISHNRGCQYYLGDYDRANDRFLPRAHGRMSWVDNGYFAPEALLMPDGRQIMWAWLPERREDEAKRFGWSGVYGVPRSLWLREDGTLGIAPIAELRRLCGRMWSEASEVRSDRLLMEAEFAAGAPASMDVLVSPDGTEFVRISYDPARAALSVDVSQCGREGSRRIETAPLTLTEREPLKLTVFVDASIVEVFANDRQAIGRRAFPCCADATGVRLGETATAFRAWEMDYTNPY